MQVLVLSMVLLPPTVLGNLAGQVCTNVSYAKPLTYKDGGDVCCKTKVIEPLCEEKMEEICMQVEEMKCEIMSWSECTMRDCPVECTSPEPVPRVFKKQVCHTVPHSITHTKMRPVCHNETKLNCITLWTMDGKGNKVWAGKDQCEEVNWLKCEQEPYQANFTTMRSVCEEDGEVPYDTCKNTTSISNQMCIDCKPMAVPKCWTVKREECATVSVKHCEPQTATDCDTKVRIPWQEWVHQEKCLFAQDGTLSNSPPSQFSIPVTDTGYRKGKVNFHNPFSQQDHHSDEYGYSQEPEGYVTGPTLDYDLEPEFEFAEEKKVRRDRKVSHFHQAISPFIINERAEYNARMG